MADILVVDDEIGIRELLSEVLQDEGHMVSLAENASQARVMHLSKRHDLVLLDIWMPDTDGVSLLKEWSAQQLLTSPVIMMSGHATIETAVEATRIGAIDFLEKPIALAKLLQTIDAALARKPALPAANAASPYANRQSSETEYETFEIPKQQAVPAATTPDTPALSSQETALNALLQIDLNGPLRVARDAFERAYLIFHLENEKGSMTRVAERTGLERTHLYRKIRQLGIDKP
jgi:DNA-binding NtrC family response regulator